jgi:DNA anti-recombination protein RmuC
VYDRNPASPIDLMSFPTNQSYSADADERAKAIKEIHDQVRKQIEKQNQKYEKQANKHRRAVIFKECDLV